MMLDVDDQDLQPPPPPIILFESLRRFFRRLFNQPSPPPLPPPRPHPPGAVAAAPHGLAAPASDLEFPALPHPAGFPAARDPPVAEPQYGHGHRGFQGPAHRYHLRAPMPAAALLPRPPQPQALAHRLAPSASHLSLRYARTGTAAAGVATGVRQPQPGRIRSANGWANSAAARCSRSCNRSFSSHDAACLSGHKLA